MINKNLRLVFYLFIYFEIVSFLFILWIDPIILKKEKKEKKMQNAIEMMFLSQLEYIIISFDQIIFFKKIEVK